MELGETLMVGVPDQAGDCAVVSLTDGDHDAPQQEPDKVGVYSYSVCDHGCSKRSGRFRPFRPLETSLE